ncbi:hypothetical protein [Mobilicoccus caccae]|uniref:Transcriptional regulator, AbiEi antitoxin, Type IV TA system n=1 Tax=Mobilicoccus caccae TaxID=1859295 RepID=A0ABQ6IRD5_9MICO|nr:hypothetical protein [Mobilicoccus caccae]GMA39243.1 hypothetical protein GCM10025883_12880 [Mobilicoccus caccae]
MSRNATAYDLPYSARNLPAPLIDVLHRQHGLASLDQLWEAGLTRAQVRWKLHHGWSAPLPRVVLVGEGRLSPVQRSWAGLLYAGEDALLTGEAASSQYGIRQADSVIVDVLVPHTCASRRCRWVRVRRAAVWEDWPRTLQGMNVVSPERAVVDAARWSADDRRALALVIEACQRRVTTPERLWRELAVLGRGTGTGLVRRALSEAESGAWSVAEVDLAALVRRSPVLPPPMLNPTLTAHRTRLTTPDLWFDDVALAVMVHSKAHHLLGDDWAHTVESDGDLVVAGATVIGITPTTLRRDPAGALRRVEAAYGAARSRPRPTHLHAA